MILPQPTVTHTGIFSTATRLTLSTPIPAARGVRVGDLLAFGELGSETIDGLITSVQPRREMSARVTLLPWSSPGVYDSETGPIPPYITGLTALPGSRYTLVINSFRSDESALRREGHVLVPGVAVDVEPIGDFRAVIEAQIRPASTEVWEAAVIRTRAGGYIELGEVVEGTAYDFRFRWSRGMRLFPGAWVEQLDHTIVGQTSPPAALGNFSVHPALEGFRAIWTNPESIDLAGVIVYTGTTTAFAAASEAGRTSDNYFLATGLTAGVALQVWARAVDFGGREGPLSGPLEVTPPAGAAGLDGVDGTGFEFVFRRTATDVAPATPVTTTAQRAMDDFVPADWFDDPQGPTDTLPYEWVTVRTGSTLAWGPFSSASLWSRFSTDGLDGADGPGVEFVFRTTTTEAAPTLTQLASDVMQLDDQVPTNWADDPQGVDATNRFEWVSRRARNSAGVWGDFSAPAQWAVYIPGQDGVDGAGVEFVFRRTATDSSPGVPATTAAQRAMDDFVPTGWSDDPAGPSAALPYEWVTKRTGSTQAWGPFVTVSLWSRFGADGAGVEWIFRLTAVATAPATPVTTTAQRAMDDFVPTGWFDDAQQLTDALPYQWFSIRRGTTGAWNEFAAPKLLNRTGVRTHDIGSDSQPAAALGNVGDTAINDAGMYWFKESSGWDLRGDLTDGHVYFSDDLIAAGHAGTLPPPDAFGFNNDIAIGPNGRVMRRVNGAWVDVELDIPTPTGLSAVYTIVQFDLDTSIAIYDLNVEWSQESGDYLAEVDVGFVPSGDIDDLAGASWRDLDGVSATNFHVFSAIRTASFVGRAVRVRHIGSFGQRGPWAYTLYSPDTALAIDSFGADDTEIASGDPATLTWVMRNAESASINQGVGALSDSQLESGSVQVFPTVSRTYTLTAIRGSETVTASVTITVSASLAQPRIVTFAPDDSTLDTSESTTIRWTLQNVLAGRITGPSLNRLLTSSELSSGSISVGPFSVGNQNYSLTVEGEAGTTDDTDSFTIVVSSTPPPDEVTIDSFSALPSTIDIGDPVTVTWQTSNATSVTLNGVTVSDDGSGTFNPEADTNYVLRASGPGGPVTQTRSVEVTQQPVTPDPTATISANDTSIAAGDSVTITWSTANANQHRLIIRLLPGTGFTTQVVGASGSLTFTPSFDTIYRIQAWHTDDLSNVANDQLTVSVSPYPPSIDSFSASPTTINSGDTVTVTWATTHAVRVRVRGLPESETLYTVLFDSSSPDGSRDATITAPSGLYYFNLIAYNSDDDTDSDVVSITVN